MEEAIIKIENLTKCYQKSRFILEIPCLEFHEGKVYGIVGPNGAGKTTLLNILNLLEEPTGGEIFFRGQKANNSTNIRLNIRRKMSMVMENPLLFQGTIFKNITTGLRIHSIDKKVWRQRAMEVLRAVGLEKFEKRNTGTLSRGEVQRATIARALGLKPEILLLDEPFTNIDRKNIGVVERMIKNINEKYHTTIILTTHDLLQAYRLSDEVISIVDGRVVNGSLENYFTGEIEEARNLKFARISQSVKLAVVTDKKNKVNISIAPQDIILSGKLLESSARNSFRGTVKSIRLENQTVRVSVSVNGEVEFTTLITKVSYENLNISVGKDVFLTFKSTSIITF